LHALDVEFGTISLHTGRMLLAVIVAITAGSLIAQQPSGIAASQGQKTVSVPFVGCRSDGQAGPNEAPKGTSTPVALSPKEADGLAYYSVSSAPGTGVLGPRGWYCFGTYGSGGGSLFVSPQPFDARDIFSRSWSGFRGPAIERNGSNGGGSGEASVAPVVARVFPAYKWYALIQEREFDQKLVFGRYPSDILSYKGDSVVEFTTPGQADGLGTQFSLKKNSSPIHGVAIIDHNTFDLVVLSVRLPSNLTRLASAIVRQLELDAVPASRTQSAR
jgi:hypothetical protein